MTIPEFIAIYNVRPADAVVVKKETLGILDHYVIYLGVDEFGEHKFIANYSKGVQFISQIELLRFLKSYIPVRLNRFIGNEEQRSYAIKRAFTKLNEKAYNLIINNCEHFANWVQRGLARSEQVDDIGKALTLSGAGLGLLGASSNNEGAMKIGFFAAAIGILIMGLGNNDN